MAAINFPTGATNGTTYTDDFGRLWTYNGSYWSIDSSGTIGVATESVTGLLSHVTQNIGGAKTFFANATFNGTIGVLSNTNSTSSTTGALTIVGGIGVSGRLSSGTGISVLSTTDSTSTNTGAITVLGGIGMSANLYSRGVGLAQNASVSTYSSLFKANSLAQSANYTYYLPQTAPSQGQSLQVTNVSGTDYTLSWVSQITKSITILSPQATDKVTLFAVPYAATITKLQAVVRGSASPAVHYTLKYGTDRTSGTTMVAIGSTVNSTTTGNTVTSFDNSTPAADSYVWMEVVAITGTVDEYHLTVSYR